MRAFHDRRWPRWATLLLPLLMTAATASADTTGAKQTKPAQVKPKAASKPAPAAPTKQAVAKTRKKKRATTKKRRKSTKRPRRRKPKPRLAGSKAGEPNDSVRRQLTGEHPNHSNAKPTESAELKALREVDQELFPPTMSPSWNQQLQPAAKTTTVDLSGLPDGTDAQAVPKTAANPAHSWLAKLTPPDFPVRYDPAVVEYLKFYKDTPRGRRLIAAFVRKSGRYRKAIVDLLRHYGMPEDILWLALVESAFNPTIHSHAGAAGLWQFMPATGRIYGLTVNRRVDERLDPERATHAALRHLKDLHKRFGAWELAFAAYNMGYGGLLGSIRKFNTNDYWELRRLEAGLPYETALYVPKIMAIAIAANNCKLFGCDAITLDAPAKFGAVGQVKAEVGPGTKLAKVAKAVGLKPAKLAALNPHIIGHRLPPLQQSTLPRKAWTVYVPTSTAPKAINKLPLASAPPSLGVHTVRWGENLAAVAAAYGTSSGFLEQLNDLFPHQSTRPGTQLFVPRGRTPKPDRKIAEELGRVAVVPDHAFDYADRRRVFYEPVFGDTVEDVARVCGVTAGEIRRWNHLDRHARLQRGMRLQLFIPTDQQPANVLLFEEATVDLITVESPKFFSHVNGPRGRQRVEITARAGDTWRKLGRRYGQSVSSLERINHKSRRSKLRPGDKVVVYAKDSALPKPPKTNGGKSTNAKPDGVANPLSATPQKQTPAKPDLAKPQPGQRATDKPGTTPLRATAATK